MLALPACQRPEDPTPPADLLPKARLVALLTDLHLLEAQLSSVRLSPDSARALYQSQEQLLLRRHGVSDSAFQRSYRYYSVHGRDLEDTYQAVLDSLAAHERRLNHGQVAPDQPWRHK